jgi:hypothetical protein
MYPKISATMLSTFMACTTKYRLQYVEGLTQDIDADALRVGSNWHSILEVYYAMRNATDHETALQETMRHLNKRYEIIPTGKKEEDWAVEREKLWRCLVGYLEYYKGEQIKVLALEHIYEVPLYVPRGVEDYDMPQYKNYVKSGRIDAIIDYNGQVRVMERKSTSESVAWDSDYWTRLKKDIQVSIYSLSFRDMAGEIYPGLTAGNVLYDVWSKPTIKLRKGEGVQEYGDRLSADIQNDPSAYFARKEIARTDKELESFEEELYNIVRAMEAYEAGGFYHDNPYSCRNPFPCTFLNICYGAEKFVSGTIPLGYKKRSK